MKKNNIVLDFSGNKSMDTMLAGQPLAIMPAELAKKLLKIYANTFIRADAADIINDHITDLHIAAAEKDLNTAMKISFEWLQERDLIKHILCDDWDAYKVDREDILRMKTDMLEDDDNSEFVSTAKVMPKLRR